MDNRQPSPTELPHDHEAEADLLGLILKRENIMSEIQPILPTEECFLTLSHRDIYRTMLSLHNQTLPVNITTVNTGLARPVEEGWRSLLVELQERASVVSNPVKIAEIIEEIKIALKIIQASFRRLRPLQYR